MEENQIVLEQVVAVTEFSGITEAGCKGPRRWVGSPRLGRVWRAILLAGAMFALASCTWLSSQSAGVSGQDAQPPATSERACPPGSLFCPFSKWSADWWG